MNILYQTANARLIKVNLFFPLSSHKVQKKNSTFGSFFICHLVFGMFFVICDLQNKLVQILQHLLVLCLKPVKTTQSLFSFQSYVSGGGEEWQEETPRLNLQFHCWCLFIVK